MSLLPFHKGGTRPPRLKLYNEGSMNGYNARRSTQMNYILQLLGELRRIPIPRTPVNKGKGRVFAIEYVSRDSVCYERVASG